MRDPSASLRTGFRRVGSGLRCLVADRVWAPAYAGAGSNLPPSRGKGEEREVCVNCIGDGGWIELGYDEFIYRQAGGH